MKPESRDENDRGQMKTEKVDADPRLENSAPLKWAPYGHHFFTRWGCVQVHSHIEPAQSISELNWYPGVNLKESWNSPCSVQWKTWLSDMWGKITPLHHRLSVIWQRVAAHLLSHWRNGEFFKSQSLVFIINQPHKYEDILASKSVSELRKVWWVYDHANRVLSLWWKSKLIFVTRTGYFFLTSLH